MIPIISLFMITDSYWTIIVLAMVGKFVIAPTFSYIYISTTELYPTQVSSCTIHSLCNWIFRGLKRLKGVGIIQFYISSERAMEAKNDDVIETIVRSL